jgi:hypothetical protein
MSDIDYQFYDDKVYRYFEMIIIRIVITIINKSIAVINKESE